MQIIGVHWTLPWFCDASNLWPKLNDPCYGHIMYKPCSSSFWNLIEGQINASKCIYGLRLQLESIYCLLSRLDHCTRRDHRPRTCLVREAERLYNLYILYLCLWPQTIIYEIHTYIFITIAKIQNYLSYHCAKNASSPIHCKIREVKLPWKVEMDEGVARSMCVFVDSFQHWGKLFYSLSHSIKQLLIHWSNDLFLDI